MAKIVIDNILETNREYVLRFVDEFGDYEEIRVDMATEHINPESRFFTHCNVKLNTIKNRTIDDHIQYLEIVIYALKQLKGKLTKGQ